MTIDERLERVAERHESLMRFLEESSREYDRRFADDGGDLHRNNRVEGLA